jgi:hypothetical protein
VAVERARRPERPEPPDVPQQLRLRPDPRRLPRQSPQQRELLLRQRHPHAAQADLARDRVELQVADPQPPLRRTLARTPQQRHDPQPQLAVGERLRQEVVAAALESADAIGLPRAPGQHDHRQPRVEPRARVACLAHLAQQLETRAVRQAEVDDREVDVVVLERPHRVAQ